MRTGRQRILTGMLLAVSAALFVYPFFMNSLAQLRQKAREKAFCDSALLMSREDLEKERRTAEEYNRSIAKEQESSPFRYRGSEATDPQYEAALGSGDGMMAVIGIETIGLKLPVMHGTAEDVLSYAAGHMYGTSLPCGGSGTHCVIAGHTGLPEAVLFTELVKMKEGDLFYVDVLGERHWYETDQVRVVLPGEESSYLQVEQNRDLITLYTCTPYGVNDHRLLVRGTRRDDLEQSGVRTESGDDRITGILKPVLLAMIPVLLLTGGCFMQPAPAKKRRNYNSDRAAAARRRGCPVHTSLKHIRRSLHENSQIPVCIRHRIPAPSGGSSVYPSACGRT